MFDADGNEMVDKREFMVVCFPLALYLSNWLSACKQMSNKTRFSLSLRKYFVRKMTKKIEAERLTAHHNW